MEEQQNSSIFHTSNQRIHSPTMDFEVHRGSPDSPSQAKLEEENNQLKARLAKMESLMATILHQLEVRTPPAMQNPADSAPQAIRDVALHRRDAYVESHHLSASMYDHNEIESARLNRTFRPMDFDQIHDARSPVSRETSHTY